MPPVQTIRRPGSSSVTFTGKARSGLASVTTLTFSPRATRPSTSRTPESHRGHPGVSVSTAHTASGLASIVAAKSYAFMPPPACRQTTLGNLSVTVTGLLPSGQMPMDALDGDPFDALGDPNRRAILQLLGRGDRSVQQLADALPISRPAVSRHLRLLKDAGLVTDRVEGTRRLYRLHDEGIGAVRVYLEQVWGDAATRFRLAAENTERPGS